MIKIKKITIHNFKSYKGTHIIEMINNHLNAIVGPNGCGKSNIIDAILFLFGFRAKKLRHKVATDLIYNNEDCEFAFVELDFECNDFQNSFKNKNKRIKTKESFEGKGKMKNIELEIRKKEMVTIRRTIYMNKKSVYHLNNQEVSFSDIQMFLKKYGLDQNKFLILQGEIESISMMPPKNSNNSNGLLEYIDEVIGTNEYKEEIEELENKIEGIKEEDVSKKSVFQFIKKDFMYVKEEYDKNVENLNNLLEYKRNLVEMKTIISEIKRREDLKISEMIIENQNESKKLKESNSQLSEKMNKSKMELKDLKKEFIRIEEEYYKSKKVYEKIKYENKNKKWQLEKLVKEIEKLELEINDNENKKSIIETEKKNIKKEIEDNKKEIKEIQNKIEKIKMNISKYQVNDKNLKKFKNQNSKIHDLKLKIKIKNNELSVLNQTKIEFEDKIQKLEEDLKDFDEILRYKNLESDINQTQEEIKKRKYKLSELLKIENQINNCNVILESLKQIKGVHGRLGDLGTTDSQYEIAIGAASKGQLNNIVVDTTSTAEKCIEIIKKKNLPRTTFIILDKIQNIPKDFKIKNEKKQFLYLIDLIKCDPQYLKCFYFVFGDTILCENIEFATKISFGFVRKRTVTYDGKVIEKSGLMVNNKIKAGIKTNKIQNMRDELNKIENALEKMLKIKEKKDKLSIYNDSKEIINLKNHRKQELIEIDNKIIKIKEGINKLECEISKSEKKNSDESEENIELKSKRTEIEINFERMEMLEERNRELFIRDNNLIFEDIKSKIKKKKLLEQEKDKIILNEPESIEKIENKYLELKNDVNLKESEILDLKNKLGIDYYRESELKMQLEDLNENKKNVSNVLKSLKIEIDNENKFIENHEMIAIEDEDEIQPQKIKKINKKSKKIKTNSKSQENTESDSDDENKKPFSYKDLPLEELQEYQNNLKYKLKSSEKKLKEIDNRIFEFYKQKKQEYLTEKQNYDNFIKNLENIQIKYQELKQKRHSEFMEGFKLINEKLKYVYSKITFGGNAELECLDYLDPYSEGIILSIMPPKKSWKPISNLSGGEKTLSSLSLVFALHLYKPSPFYFMDEIDAALDFRNVSVIANFLKENKTQFIIISLRTNMFEVCENLIGVYRYNGDSKIICYNAIC